MNVLAISGLGHTPLAYVTEIYSTLPMAMMLLVAEESFANSTHH